MELPKNKKSRTDHLAVFLVIIFAIQVEAVIVSHFGDHFFGSKSLEVLVYSIGAGFLALAVQIFVLIPIYVIEARRAKENVGANAIAWVLGSIFAFSIPLPFGN